jgi:hypothetical protein
MKTRRRTILDSRGNVIGEEKQSEIRLWDKLRAMEILGKHSGFLNDTSVNVVIDVADRLINARGRVMKSTGVIEYSSDTVAESDERDERDETRDGASEG